MKFCMFAVIFVVLICQIVHGAPGPFIDHPDQKMHVHSASCHGRMGGGGGAGGGGAGGGGTTAAPATAAPATTAAASG